MCHIKSKRLRDAMSEIEQALKVKTPSDTLIDGTSLLRKAQILKERGDFKDAELLMTALIS